MFLWLGLIRWLEVNRLSIMGVEESAGPQGGTTNEKGVGIPHSSDDTRRLYDRGLTLGTFGVVRLPDCLDTMPQTSQDGLPPVEVEDVTVR